MSTLSVIALVLVIIGALNWGLVGLFRFDLVSAVFGGAGIASASPVSRIIFILVAIAGLWCIPLLFHRDSMEH